MTFSASVVMGKSAMFSIRTLARGLGLGGDSGACFGTYLGGEMISGTMTANLEGFLGETNSGDGVLGWIGAGAGDGGACTTGVGAGAGAGVGSSVGGGSGVGSSFGGSGSSSTGGGGWTRFTGGGTGRGLVVPHFLTGEFLLFVVVDDENDDIGASFVSFSDSTLRFPTMLLRLTAGALLNRFG